MRCDSGIEGEMNAEEGRAATRCFSESLVAPWYFPRPRRPRYFVGVHSSQPPPGDYELCTPAPSEGSTETPLHTQARREKSRDARAKYPTV
jgi:hypothetical protein